MYSRRLLAWRAVLVCAGLSFGALANANTVSASPTPPPNHALTVNATGSTTTTTTQSYPQGTVVSLSPVPTPGYQFMAWSGSCTGNSPACAVTMSGARTVGARFGLALTVAVTGSGTVTSAPAGINCGSDCSEVLSHGTNVTLTAAPATGQAFNGWSGACSGTAPTCTVSMSAARNVTAAFVPSTVQTWTRIAGEGASFTVSGTQTVRYGAGSSWIQRSVTNSGQCTNAFFGSDPARGVVKSCEVLSGGGNTTSHLLSTTVSGSGSVTSAPSGINCGTACSASFASGSSVTLTATPAPGHAFTGWTGNCSGTAPTCTVAMSAARSAGAAFSPSSGGALTASLQATRTSGVAPLAVQFDATGTTAAAGVLPFHQVSYDFNFGDERGQSWALSGAPKNTQRGGPLAAHVFDIPGTYTVRVRAQASSGSVSDATVTVTVQSPDTVFSGTKTVCVSGSSNYTGCPAGALQQTTLPGSYGGKRVLLRRGERFGTITPLHTDAAFQVGAFGSGVKPVVEGVYTGMAGGVAAWANDFTVMDLNIGSGGVGIDATVSKLLLYRSDINTPNTSGAFQVNIGTAVGYYQSHGTGPVPGAIYWPREVFIVENDIQGVINPTNNPGAAVFGYFAQSAMMGNTIDKATEHSMRVWAAHKLFLAHNAFGGNHYAPNPPGIRAALKMHSNGTQAYSDTVAGSPLLATRFIVMADNTFGSPTYQGSWIMGVGPQNADPGTIEKCEDIIMERNRFVRGPWTSQDFHFLAGRVTTRDNVVAGGGALWFDMVTPEESRADPANNAWSGPYFGQAQ